MRTAGFRAARRVLLNSKGGEARIDKPLESTVGVYETGLSI